MAGVRLWWSLLCLAVATQGASVTPMEKVIGLLKSLSAKVASEGKKEAAQYDKFACFCKEQADEKLYNIETSEAKISDLAAEIEELNTAIAKLNSDISDLSKKISQRESTIKQKTADREKAHAEYAAKATDMNEAIEACKAAIESLKDSKGDMEGAKLDFAQVKQATSNFVKAVSKQSLLSNAPGAVALLSKFGDLEAPKFEYQSNDIIATLEDLLATFKSMKKDLDFEEHNDNAAFESTRLGLQNEIKFAEKDKAEKEAVVESKTEELEAAKTDKDEETKDKDADDAFMKELTKECEATALLFDQRSKVRSEELTTLAEATEELQKGAVPNESANKKLVGLQRKVVVEKAKVSVGSATFLQIKSIEHNRAGEVAVIKNVIDQLHGAAGRTKSTALAALTMRIKVSEDHFVKVRALIKDLIERLKDQAKAEASTKSFCDKGMKKAIDNRDSANSQIEAANAKITSLTAKKNDLTSTIALLQNEIAELKKGLLERTELRNEDKAENTETVEMSEEAIESVKLALNLLKDFYNKAGFLQTGKYTPPKADRSGATVGDLAPEFAGENYKGAQTESKGIVGILEVILSDFERTKKTTESEEKTGKDEFDDYEKETNADIKDKQGKIKTAEGELTDTNENLLKQQGALSDAQDLLESSTTKLDDLKAMCVAGEETWEERKEKREEEIQALKDALQTLEDWKKTD